MSYPDGSSVVVKLNAEFEKFGDFDNSEMSNIFFIMRTELHKTHWAGFAANKIMGGDNCLRNRHNRGQCTSC